jgi:Na+/phosphate symporter
MAAELTAKAFREQLEALCPLVDHLRCMFGAARHAFNRHSTTELQELARLRNSLTLEIDPFFEKAEKALKNPKAADEPYWQRLHSILTHLEIIAANIASLETPIREKSKDNIIFSDKDFMFVNHLFTHHTGLMRTLVDIFKRDDPSLKEYIVKESEELIAGCSAAAAAHESHQMERLGQPKAWYIYLSILDHTRVILQHLMDIVTQLS